MAIKRTSGSLPLLSNAKIMDIKMEEVMNKIGRIGVEWAIQNHEFNNRTKNLEDSYGYAVYKNGSIQGNPFVTNQNATKPKGGKYGHEEAIQFLKTYKPPYLGWTLVVVAAMEYAQFVEFYYKLDVLQSSEAEARQAADKLLRNIEWVSR